MADGSAPMGDRTGRSPIGRVGADADIVGIVDDGVVGAELDEGTDPDDGVVGADWDESTDPHDVDPDYVDPDDDPDDDEDDDIFARRPHPLPAATGHPGGSGRPSRTSTALMVLAVLAGVVLGVWYAGRSGGPTAPLDAMTSSGNASLDAATQQRMTELMAAVQADPGDVDARLELGVLFFNAGDLDKAKTQWDAVTRLAPDNAGAWYNLGFYYLSSSPPNAAAAKAAWAKVVALDPGSDMAATVASHLDALGSSGGSPDTGPSPSPGVVGSPSPASSGVPSPSGSMPDGGATAPPTGPASSN